MKNFQIWLEDRKSLALAYKDALKDIPQDFRYHKEGNVLTHSRLVRKSVQKAIHELNDLKKNHPQVSYILSNIDFNLNLEEQRMANIAAWIHDIGKATATKMNGVEFDKKHLNWEKEQYQDNPLSSYKISSAEHETSKHYGPQIQKLKKEAPIEIVNFYESNKELFDFLIDNHMQFSRNPSNNFIKNNFKDGKLKNEKRLKLLMVLMWADKMGKIGGGNNTNKNIEKLIFCSQKNKGFEKKEASKKPFEGSVEDFKELLRSRGLPEDQIKKAIANKFGVYESFRTKKIKEKLKKPPQSTWVDRVLDDKEEDSYAKKMSEEIKEFERFLRDKGLSEDQIEKAVLNKFGIFKTEWGNI